MKGQIVVTISIKEYGAGDFQRSDLVARWLRENLPVVLFRGDIDPTLKEERRVRSDQALLKGDCGRAAELLGRDSKLEGWDDYYLALRAEVNIV